ncbi:MAG: hypothetical protein PHC29_08465 [Candidatus Omnitrophica bacterium]|nr:hypothetical protein [Candidatus Omnitrophota bacterium]
MSKIRPSNGYVLIESQGSENKTVYFARSEEEGQEIGKVLAVGDSPFKNDNGAVFDYSESHVKVGDKVIYKRYTDQKVQFEGKEYLIIKVTDIIGKVA